MTNSGDESGVFLQVSVKALARCFLKTTHRRTARFNITHRLAVDGVGSLYVADLSNETIPERIPSTRDGCPRLQWRTVWLRSHRTSRERRGRGRFNGSGQLAAPLDEHVGGSFEFQLSGVDSGPFYLART